MWSYTDEENNWLESRRAADIAPKAVVPTPLQIEHYIREGEKLRAEAIRLMVRAMFRSAWRGGLRLATGLHLRPADRASLPPRQLPTV
jgi:hypothetical protein